MTAQDAAGRTPLHCMPTSFDENPRTRTVQYEPARQWKHLWRVNRFLLICEPPPLAREAWLPAVRMLDNTGQPPFWGHRLEHLRHAYWRVAAALALAPDALACALRSSGECGPLQCASSAARPCLADLPVDVRLRILERCGAVGRSSSAERQRRRRWPYAAMFKDSVLDVRPSDDGSLHCDPQTPRNSDGWITGFEVWSDDG